MTPLQNLNRIKTFIKSGSHAQTKERAQKGFTIIEIMIALALLSIVGSSLFMMQSTIFQKIEKSHNAVSNLLEIDKEMINLKLAIAQALQEKKSAADVKIHQEKQNPEITVDISLKAIKESSQLYKNFSKNVFLVQATATKNQQQHQWFSFLYVPPNQENKQVPFAKTPKGAV